MSELHLTIPTRKLARHIDIGLRRRDDDWWLEGPCAREVKAFFTKPGMKCHVVQAVADPAFIAVTLSFKSDAEALAFKADHSTIFE